MPPSRIVLYRALASRAFPVLWLLEELGLGYRSETINLRDSRRPEALRKLRPSGFTPALVDGEVAVTETPAVCLYLADRYGYGTLAPKIEDPARGSYFKWMVFSTAVLEPARELQASTIVPPQSGYGVGWPSYDLVVRELTDALEGREWLLGDVFSAAEVMLGSMISVSLFCSLIPREPALVAYSERLGERPANQRAGLLNWPPDRFPGN